MNTAPRIESPIQTYLNTLHAKYAQLHEGEVATYIPELGKANPNWFGICLVTATGAIYEVGDTGQHFTIQSISKPFVYGRALEDNGKPRVLAKVGVEPTGDAFNSISLEPGTGRPRNPMINAGAIATAGLVEGGSPSIRLRRLLDTFSTYAGRSLSLDEAVYRSESATGHRNRAIGHMLRNFDILTEDPTDTLELYFQQCSISVTCRDLAMLAATLANHGVNPITGKRALSAEYVPNVLGVMGSCGMYDFAGEWIYKVGMPAKSGVAGGIIAVLPGQLGIGVFSPRLDSHGNSVRGIRVCEDLTRNLQLHLFSPPVAGKMAVRNSFTGVDFHSTRISLAEEVEVLHEHGERIKVRQLQGTIFFSAAEVVQRDTLFNARPGDYLVFDFKRVTAINQSACWILHETFKKLIQGGVTVALSYTAHLPALGHYIKSNLDGSLDTNFRVCIDNDSALEWCERQLLEIVPIKSSADVNQPVPRSGYSLFQGFTADEFAIVDPLLESRTCPHGTMVINAGDESHEIYFLSRGTMSILLPLDSGGTQRIATVSPGMAFGEMAMSSGLPRSASVQAETDCTYDALNLEKLNSLTALVPTVKIKILNNLTLQLSEKLRKANRQVRLFEVLSA